MKNYGSKLLTSLSVAIESGNAELSKIRIADMPLRIYTNGLCYIRQSGGGFVKCDYMYDKCDGQSAKKECQKLFLRDWKKLKDAMADKYRLVEFTDHIGRACTALLRQIDIDDAYGDIIEFDYLKDLSINGSPYCVMKMFLTDTESFGLKSCLEENVFTTKLDLTYRPKDSSTQEASTTDDETENDQAPQETEDVIDETSIIETSSMPLF